MKSIIIASVVTLLTFISTSYCGEPDEQMELRCLRPVVKVAQGHGYGSGTIIRSEKMEDGNYCNVVLTCAHVTAEMTNPKVMMPGYSDWSKVDPAKNKVFDAAVYTQDEERDMAFVIFLSSQQMPVAELGFDEKLYISNDVNRIGVANDDYPRLEYGHVTGVTNKVLRTSMEAYPGDSGGPVYHHMKIVAITQRLAIVHIGDGFPAFADTKNVRITNLIPWAKEDGKAAIYKSTTALPRWTIIRLQVKTFHPKTA
jgi:S1-C subfamily serine protease